MTDYNAPQFLQLSGIQHFAFCRRQWALIHIEQQWAENYRTVDDELMHEKAHDTGKTESRDDLKITRGMYVSSRTLGVSGQCDVVELRKDPQGVEIFGYEGRWQPFPIEYKRGRPKDSDADELQLCAQAMCLEEMLCCEIPCGALFYGETHRKTERKRYAVVCLYPTCERLRLGFGKRRSRCICGFYAQGSSGAAFPCARPHGGAAPVLCRQICAQHDKYPRRVWLGFREAGKRCGAYDGCCAEKDTAELAKTKARRDNASVSE